MSYTLYERLHRNRQEQAFGTCIGKIISVDVDNRLCTVATSSGVGSMHDQFIMSCQWTYPDANPEGDECGSIPRTGSWGLVNFVDGEAFIGNFFKPSGPKGTAKQGNEFAVLNEGDKITSTKAGNRITVKRSGLIEQFVKETLQRVCMPQGSQIVDLCKRYKLSTDGGYIDWKSDTLRNTTWRAEFAKNMLRTSIISEIKGNVTTTVIKRTYIGTALPGVSDVKLPVYAKEIDITGKTVTEVSPPTPFGTPVGYKSTVNPDGSVEILAGAAQTVSATIGTTGATELDVNKLAKITVSDTGDITAKGPIGTVSVAKTGDIKVTNATCEMSFAAAGTVALKNTVANLGMTAAGEITIRNNMGMITISPAGEVAISAPLKVTIEAKTGLDVKSMGPVNIEGIGPMNIKTKGQIMLDGGPGATDNVLTFPSTLSPFTGSPLVPFSATVMVSK